MTSLAPRWSRRGFLSLAPPAQDEPEVITLEDYRGLVSQYRSGRFVETARRVASRRPAEMREAQRAFLESLPAPNELEGVRERLGAALMHAETTAHLGWGPMSDPRLCRDPVKQLPRKAVRGLPDGLLNEAVGAWGESAASDFRALVWRELVLSVARLRLARMDLLAATRMLQGADPARDAAIGWQLAAVWSVRARYIRETGLWAGARDLFQEVAARQLVSREAGARSSRAVARALGDPDDLNLRFALVALGEGELRRAAERLREVSPQPAIRLRVPRLLLLGETRIEERELRRAVEDLRAAVELAPTAPAVVAALVAALEAAGRWDEAAELATEQMGQRDGDMVWSDFLLTWAGSHEPGLDWLRALVRA